jgi:glycolate oxidase
MRYGVTKDYSIGLRAVTIEGTVIATGYFSDNESFHLGDVLGASEGTLAVLTEVAVRLTPLPPRGITILVAFDKPANAAKTVSDINSAGIVPMVMEFLDGGAVACSNEYEKAEGLDESVAGMLLLETDGHLRERQAEVIESICRKNDCSYITREPDPEKAENLWKVRRNISKAIKAASKMRFSEDVAVPNSKFPDLVAFVAEMNASSPLRIHSFGHAGDGNLHVNFLSSTGSAEESALIEKGIETVLKKAVDLGGTLSGEHGIGTAKRDYLHLEFDTPTLDAMKAFKTIFDPTGLLNPGKIFSEK